MKIYINARFLTQSVTGVQRFAMEMVKALDRLIDNGEIDKKKYDFILVAPENIKYTLNLNNMQFEKIGKLKGHLWEQVELPLYTKNTFLINLCNAAPLLKHRQLVIIYDAAVFATPKAYSFLFRLWYRILLKNICKNAASIITVSKFSKEELQRYCPLIKSKLNVIYAGSEHVNELNMKMALLDKYDLQDKPFILAVSSLNPNKNFQAIIKAMGFLDNQNMDLIIVGGVNTKIFNNVQMEKTTVKYIGYINDEELRTLYENAICFVYPSYYEGFGLPPLEAMACGCPVIVSDRASLPEVCGDAAMYCNPDKPENIAEKIALIKENDNLRKELSQKGIERAALFSWNQTAREFMAVIEKVLAG